MLKKILNSFYIQILALSVLCYLCYGSALNGTFVFDDNVAIKQNKAVSQVPTNFTAIFTSDFWGSSITSEDSHKSYRPLTSLMFHWEWVKCNLQPYHMKSINLLLHTANSILVLTVLRNLFFGSSKTNDIAFVASVLFAVHPVHTEAVAGIVSRADLMFCFIYLLCLLLCSSDTFAESLCLPVLIVGLTFIGVLFKESAITIPLACVLLNFGLELSYTLSWRQQVKILLCARNIFYGVSTLAILIFRLWLGDFKSPKFRAADNPVSHADSHITRLFSQNYLYFYNFKILILPLDLCFDWSFDCLQLIRKITDSRLLLVLSLYIITSVVLINYTRNFPPLMGLGLTVIPFLPATGIVKVGFVIAERVLYVPSIGFCYLVAYGFIWWLRGRLNNYRRYFILAFGLVVITFVLRCRQRSMEWLTEEKLFRSALNVCPNNAKVHYNIARLATDVKNNAKAFRHYHKAIELAPDYDAALMNLGNLYRDIGDLHKAENYLKKSIEVTPDFATAWMNLGIVQAANKDYKQALHSYRKALKYRKNYANCYYNLGNLYLEQNLHNEAVKNWQYAITMKPSLRQAWTNILTMLDSKAKFDEALSTSEQALKHLPQDASILFLRANVFGKLGRYKEAEKLYKQVVAKEPLNYLYHTNLAVLYHRWNRINEAIDAYKRALDVNPQKATTARENLSKLINVLAKQKKSEER